MSQQGRGTIGSQVDVLQARIAAEGHELVGEFCDDGCSGARLDRPGLDALRGQAEAGMFEVVWCLSPDRLARAYVYQVLVLDELAQFGVRVLFADAPALDDDPQLRLLTQVQGVISEYERAKIAERNRRGRLYRSRAGEVVSWKVPYGYRRLARDATGPARLEVFEPEAAVVRRIFDDYVNGGHSIRRIVRGPNTDDIPTPTGKSVWWHSTLCRILRNEAYVGRLYFNQSETVTATTRDGRRTTRQQPRPRDEWITIPCPAIIVETMFDAAQQVSRDKSKWSPRNLPDDVEAWLLRRLVRCGACDAAVGCQKIVTRSGKVHRYYWCPNHATTTRTGLTVTAERDTGYYPTGVKVTPAELAAVPLVGHQFHPDWNYTIVPRTPETQTRNYASVTPSRVLTGPTRTRTHLLAPRAPREGGPHRPCLRPGVMAGAFHRRRRPRGVELPLGSRANGHRVLTRGSERVADAARRSAQTLRARRTVR